MARMPASNMFYTRLSKRTKHRPSNTRAKEMFYVFDRMLDGLQILQTRSNSTKQGGQTVKCLVTKQCLMVFDHRTFLVYPGLYVATYTVATTSCSIASNQCSVVYLSSQCLIWIIEAVNDNPLIGGFHDKSTAHLD